MHIFRPLRHRDFALLWTGLSVSRFGDGLSTVAITFQIYALSKNPGTVALAWLAWSVGVAISLVASGFLADRFDRRWTVIAADALRMAAISTMGILAITGTLAVWHCIALMMLYGVGEAFFLPGLIAMIPSLVQEDELVQANSIEEIVRPFFHRLVGPAVGGFLVSAFGPGTALLIDSATFIVSISAVAGIRTNTKPEQVKQNSMAHLKEGYNFVRKLPWLWWTLLSAAFAMLCFWGPVQVLLPHLVQTVYGGDAKDFGVILAAGGLASIIGALTLSQRDLPRNAIMTMFTWWGISGFAIAGYGVVNKTWQAMLLCCLYAMGFSIGMVIWNTLLQTHVPQRLLGRVASLDYFASTLLIPVSFALVGPVSQAIGEQTTMIVAGLLSGTLAIGTPLLFPRIREVKTVTASVSKFGQVSEKSTVRNRDSSGPTDLDPALRT